MLLFLYIYKSTVQPCMEYWFHVWVGASICHLDMLDKFQKWLCKTVDPSFTVYVDSFLDYR